MKIFLGVTLFLFALSVFGEPEEVRLAREARQILAAPEQHAGFGFVTKPKQEVVFNVRLAVKRKGESFRTVLVTKDCLAEKGWEVFCKRDKKGQPVLNGVNTYYPITNPPGYKVYGLRRVVGVHGGSPREVVYTPGTRELATPEVVAHGKAYLRGLVGQAFAELRAAGIVSRAGGFLAVDHVDPLLIEMLAVIEHIDPDRFLSEKFEDLAGEVYSVLALNGENSYVYAVSPAGARGLFQIMPNTYQMLLGKYVEAKLERDFVRGTANHLNALKKAVLLTDYHVSLLPERLRETAFILPTVYVEYNASAYNGGPGRARGLLLAGRDLERDNPNRENRIFVAKLRALRNWLSPAVF